jgi:flagellar motor switch protein FliM
MKAPAEHRRLDPRTLGRPVHLLHHFVGPFRDDLAEVFRTTLNRRYRASFAVGEVSLDRLSAVPERCRWRSHADQLGRIGFAIERQLLLCILDYRYGASAPSGVSIAGQTCSEPRETATEERLAAMLGRQLVGALAERIEWLPAMAASQPCQHVFTETPATPPRAGIWAIRAIVSEASRGVEGALWFTLDEAWMQRLLTRLTPSREPAAGRPGRAAPLASQLQLTLTARLLEKEVPLGQLLDMRVGDLIPVRLGLTDVLVDDSRIFTARVAEHQGKLCLTAFTNVE